jgi:hypothetical protein
MLATIENMHKHHGCTAYSPTTGEEASADAGDYWWLPNGDPLVDENGDPMILVRKVTEYIEVEDSEG